MVLKFTSKAISEIEAANGNLPFYTLLTPPRVGILVQFLAKGLQKKVEDTETLVDEYLHEEGNDLTSLSLAIAEQLQADGFFPKGTNLKAEMEKTELSDYVPTAKA
jgi:hypothetical protein